MAKCVTKAVASSKQQTVRCDWLIQAVQQARVLRNQLMPKRSAGFHKPRSEALVRVARSLCLTRTDRLASVGQLPAPLPRHASTTASPAECLATTDLHGAKVGFGCVGPAQWAGKESSVRIVCRPRRAVMISLLPQNSSSRCLEDLGLSRVSLEELPTVWAFA